jgi:hypothetical protein
MGKYSAQGVTIAAGKQVKIKGTTKKFKGGEEARIKILLYEDHPSWNADIEQWENAERPGDPIGVLEFRRYKVCEDRKIPADRLQASSTVNGNEVDATWDLTWPDTNVQTEKEKYAVLRAEYYFLEKGADKLDGKSGVNGVDSLFLGKNKIIICESKCGINSKARGYYDQWLARKMVKKGPTAPAQLAEGPDASAKLGASTASAGGGRELKVHPEKKVNARLMQMSWMWVYSVIEEITGSSKSSRLKDNWVAIASLLEQDNSCVERWFNYYGYDRLYVVPGKYHIRGARFAELAAVDGKHIDAANELVVDWPESYPWVEREFQDLDDYGPFIDREDNNWQAVLKSARSKRLATKAKEKRASLKTKYGN